MVHLFQVILDGAMSGLLYALVAAGLSLIWGVMDVINFAHGEFLMVAMYLSYWIGFLAHVDPIVSWIASAAFLFLLGAVTYKLIVSRCLGKAAMAPLLATFGLSMVLKNFCLNRFSPNFRLLSGTLLEGKKILLGELVIPLPQLVTSLFALGVLALLYVLLK